MRARANQIIDLADTLRRHALGCGADMNSANLFVHCVLMRLLAAGADIDEADAQPPEAYVLDALWDGAEARRCA